MARRVLLLVAFGLAGCGAVDSAIGPVGAVQVGSTMLMGRGPVEAAYSLATGRDCSLANYAAEKRFCAQEEVARPPQYCTRSLAWVDCWTERDPYGPQRGVGDTPTPPPQRDRRWVDLRRDPPPSAPPQPETAQAPQPQAQAQ